MNDNLVPHDKRLHFGCGFAFGGLLSWVLLLEAIVRTGEVMWLLVLVVALGFAFLAMRYGEVFWAKLSSIIETLSKWRLH